jgi:uncharacterized membrane protein YbhN (UPF0104 family)
MRADAGEANTRESAKSSGTLKKLLLFAVKLTVSGGLMYLVLARAGVGKVMSLIANITPWTFVFAVVAYVFSQFIGSMRWQLLLKDRFSLKRLFPLYLLGSFFNIFLPGLVGGDAVKIYYLYKETGKGTQSLASVVMDRYVGYTALMLVGLMAFPFGLKYFGGTWVQWVLPGIIATFFIASLIGFGLRLGKQIRFISNFYDYFHSYRSQRSVVARALLLSMFLQSVIIFSIWILSLGLRMDVPLHMLYVFMPIIATVSALPISISGIGIREAATVLLLGTIGVEPDMATALSFAWFLSICAGGLTGLYEYLRVKEKRPAEEVTSS